MKQPVKGGERIKRKKTPIKNRKRQHQEYGTSKLEVFFGKNFLNKLGLTYVYEFEAREIKRYYDFAVVADDETLLTEERNGLMSVNDKRRNLNPLFIIEIDGSYHHSDPRVVDINNLNPMQKRNKRVDEAKNKWCSDHHIPLLRIWEYDIRNNPSFAMEKLVEYAEKYAKKYIKLKNKAKTF